MLLAPPWAGTSHVVQLWPVGIEATAPQAEPELRFSAEMSSASIQLAAALVQEDPLGTRAMEIKLSHLAPRGPAPTSGTA